VKTFKDKTAVITGAGSGIGKAFAFEAAKRGMKLVLADINETDLTSTNKALTERGAKTLAIPTDVSKASDIETLAQESQKAFGKIHLVFNNAGVSSSPKPILESSQKDWDWVMGVNLQSIIYSIKSFVPQILEHGEEAHIVNTASIAGLIANSRMNTYNVTKHAVVALSETLYLDLEEAKSNVAVSVFCPAWIKTQIHNSARNRPEVLKNEKKAASQTSIEAANGIKATIDKYGYSVEDVIPMLFKGIEDKDLYILTHKPFNKLIEKRFQAILGQHQLSSSW